MRAGGTAVFAARDLFNDLSPAAGFFDVDEYSRRINSRIEDAIGTVRELGVDVEDTELLPDGGVPETVEVDHAGETLEVPTRFTTGDVATWFGSPLPVDVTRIFVYDGHVRAEGTSEGKWVEVGYFPEADHSDTLEAGWVAEALGDADEFDVDEGPGKTLWRRGGNA